MCIRDRCCIGAGVPGGSKGQLQAALALARGGPALEQLQARRRERRASRHAQDALAEGRRVGKAPEG
eukprot:14739545-Alexandrium_andersonii.AAC.1